jgi:hypothetical protein
VLNASTSTSAHRRSTSQANTSSEMVIRPSVHFRMPPRLSTPLSLPAPNSSPTSSRWRSSERGAYSQVAWMGITAGIGAISTWNGGWTAIVGVLGCVCGIVMYMLRDRRHLVPSIVSLAIVALFSQSNTYQTFAVTTLVLVSTLFAVVTWRQ